MQKFLKLTGVSVLAIVAATGANAAGYTCEELIEYTACNDGWYLNDGDCIESTTCPSGSYLRPFCSVSDCGVSYDSETEEYTCCDGDYVANLECIQCPSVGLTDKDGKVVSVKSQPGSMGVGSCYIDPNAYFKDSTGTYHYKSNCSVRFWETSPDTEEECTSLGFEWVYTSGESDSYYVCALNMRISEQLGLIKTEEECNAAAEKIYGLVWKDEGDYYYSRCETINYEESYFIFRDEWYVFGDPISHS